MQRNLDEIFARLAGSAFRRRFRLGARERDYFDRRGLETMMAHAADFIAERLAPAHPKSDGKQTPMRNHPVFIAQHATATCCRGCLEKWHAIPRGRELNAEETAHVLAVLRRWLVGQSPPGA
jgi:hypothetical protein